MSKIMFLNIKAAGNDRTIRGSKKSKVSKRLEIITFAKESFYYSCIVQLLCRGLAEANLTLCSNKYQWLVVQYIKTKSQALWPEY